MHLMAAEDAYMNGGGGMDIKKMTPLGQGILKEMLMKPCVASHHTEHIKSGFMAEKFPADLYEARYVLIGYGGDGLLRSHLTAAEIQQKSLFDLLTEKGGGSDAGENADPAANSGRYVTKSHITNFLQKCEGENAGIENRYCADARTVRDTMEATCAIGEGYNVDEKTLVSLKEQRDFNSMHPVEGKVEQGSSLKETVSACSRGDL